MTRSSEERYRAIIEDQTDVIRRFLPDGILTFVNDAYCKFFMRPKEVVIGDNLFHSVKNEVAAAIRESLKDLTHENPVKIHERLVQLRNGEHRWVQWIDRAIFDKNNVVVEYQSTGRDITDLKMIQEELSTRNRQLTTLNAIVNTLMESRDLQVILTAALEKAIEVLHLDGGWIYLLQKNTKRKKLLQIVQSGIPVNSNNHGKEIFLENKIFTADPDHFPKVLSASVNTFYQGYLSSIFNEIPWLFSTTIQGRDQVMGVLGGFSIVNTISPKKEEIFTIIARQIGVTIENIQLEQKDAEIAVMKEVNRIRSDLIANVSHEMKTPLGLIMIMASSLLREEVTVDQETRQSLIQDIYGETCKLDEIVDNLLSISSVQSRKERLQLAPINLEEIVQGVIRTLSAQLSDHKILVDFPKEPIMMNVDSRQIEEVLKNLVINAIKYSPSQTTISIHANKIGEELVIRIKDQGFGFPESDKEKIFDRFYRVGDERVKQSPGVGLGLPICKEIVEAHGGRIWAESKLDHGSSIFFSLPFGE